jgi:hypothetical protein
MVAGPAKLDVCAARRVLTDILGRSGCSSWKGYSDKPVRFEEAPVQPVYGPGWRKWRHLKRLC